MKIEYDRCTFPVTSGACNNQNFGLQHCYYHKKVEKGLITPESSVVTLSSLPSYSNMGDD